MNKRDGWKAACSRASPYAPVDFDETRSERWSLTYTLRWAALVGSVVLIIAHLLVASRLFPLALHVPAMLLGLWLAAGRGKFWIRLIFGVIGTFMLMVTITSFIQEGGFSIALAVIVTLILSTATTALIIGFLIATFTSWGRRPRHISLKEIASTIVALALCFSALRSAYDLSDGGYLWDRVVEWEILAVALGMNAVFAAFPFLMKRDSPRIRIWLLLIPGLILIVPLCCIFVLNHFGRTVPSSVDTFGIFQFATVEFLIISVLLNYGLGLFGTSLFQRAPEEECLDREESMTTTSLGPEERP